MGRTQANFVRMALAGLAFAGCSDVDAGVVEISWRWVDRDGDPIFPAGQFTPVRGSCGIDARGAGDVDLQLELAICEESCAADCDESCEVVPPERFGCDAARATLNSVPASEEPYLFMVRAVIDGLSRPCVSPPPSCIAVPGPRARTVHRGLVTDLQVYQLAVDLDLDGDAALDVGACGCE
ncbi:MAG: hypothetical protein IAG13_15180 [Deltaproteobacteria bacterium]|nr:hypothetical protein [Nannocystaceae bacterium]